MAQQGIKRGGAGVAVLAVRHIVLTTRVSTREACRAVAKEMGKSVESVRKAVRRYRHLADDALPHRDI